MLRPASGDSPLCLSAQAHVHVSLCRLLSVTGLEPECGSRADHVRRCRELAGFIAEKALPASGSWADRFLLADTLYFLTMEAEPFCDAARMNRCHDILIGLMEEYTPLWGTPGDCRVEPALCRCLEAYFYPQWEADDAWAVQLRGILEQWCDTLSTEGEWAGLPDAVAWQRLETLNRYSYLFLDTAFDAAVRRACACYVRRTAANSLPVEALYACHVALSQGHLLAGYEACAARVAALLGQRLSRLTPASADGCCCLAVSVEQLCRTVLLACRKELCRCTA